MTHETILQELSEYCAEAGLKPSTVCVRALNNSRFVERYTKRLDALERDAERLRKYMRATPVKPREDAA